ncbi:MAG: DUF4163 domain-containing protein [Clostridiales bacterium]|nr:DUF4163 domain-containing protein [Clostridiales bacterium]
MEKGTNRLSYPQLSGLADPEIQKAINDDLFLSANLAAHMVTFTTLADKSPWGLVVSYEEYITGDVASFVISADGKMPNGRKGQINTALTYDLTTGKRVTAADLFTDVAEAQAWMEEEAVRTLGEEISEYTDSGVLLPLPVDRFTLDAYGITFYYAAEQFATLSGKAGACRFDYTELAAYLRSDEGSLPVRLSILPPEMTAAEQKTAIEEALSNGKIEQLPISLGDNMTGIVDAYGLKRTPDEFPGGRYFVMEHPMFRNILLISDSMQSGYEHSMLQGIQLRRGAFCGLKIGQSQRDDWQKLLGEPDDVILLTENMAYDYNLPTGTCDLYRRGSTLRLYADESGVLVAVQLERMN